jgi:hypothetical protein
MPLTKFLALFNAILPIFPQERENLPVFSDFSAFWALIFLFAVTTFVELTLLSTFLASAPDAISSEHGVFSG